MNIASSEPETIFSDYNLLHSAHVYQDAVILDNKSIGERLAYNLEEWQALGYDQNSLIKQGPLFKNFPVFAARTNAEGSTTRIYYELSNLHETYPIEFETGDHIEYEYDKVVRTVTAVGSDGTGNYIEVDIPLTSNSTEDEYLLNWKDNTDYNINVSLSDNSPCIDAGTDLATKISNSDILGNQRNTWDIGAYEYITGTNIPPASSENMVSFHVYPNPANSNITILYSLPKKSDVEIVLYDVTGRKVKNLFEGHQASGGHSMNVELHNIEAGVYFLKLNTGTYTYTNKCIISH